MKKPIVILTALLALQLALAVGLNLGRDQYRAFEPEEKLLAVDAGDVDGLRIDAGEGQHVLMEKQEDQWRLPDLAGFPADQGSVARLLERLAGLEKGWPVATTAGASKRFKVSDPGFERKLTLSKGEETLAALLVGTSPGFRKVHVRVPGEDEIYAVGFSAFEANAKSDDWIDKGVLAQQADEIERIDMPGLTLNREDGRLLVADLDEGEETAEDEARRLVDRIAGLRIRAVLGTEEKPEYDRDQSELRYSIALASGAEQEYVFFKPEQADHYVLKASHRDEYFQVDTWAVDPVKEVTRAKLVREKVAGTAAAEEGTEDEQTEQGDSATDAGTS